MPLTVYYCARCECEIAEEQIFCSGKVPHDSLRKVILLPEYGVPFERFVSKPQQLNRNPLNYLDIIDSEDKIWVHNKYRKNL